MAKAGVLQMAIMYNMNVLIVKRNFGLNFQTEINPSPDAIVEVGMKNKIINLKTNMKNSLILLILLILSCSFAFGQKVKTANLKLCDTDKFSLAPLDTMPCLVPVIKAGKLTGYTEQIFRERLTATASFFDGQPNFAFNTITGLSFTLITMEYKNMPKFSIDYPKDTDTAYVIHIKRKYVHWLNDTTMVYSYHKK